MYDSDGCGEAPVEYRLLGIASRQCVVVHCILAEQRADIRCRGGDDGCSSAECLQALTLS